MASFVNQLSFFFLFVLVLSPQIQAREGKPFSLFTHFRTIYRVKDPLEKAKSPSLTPELAPTLAPELAPALAPELAPTPAPSASQEIGSTIPSGPAPVPEFLESGQGYGLYGRGSYSKYSPTKESTPTTTTTTTTFENKLLNEDFNDESYRSGYPKTNFYSNNEEYKTYDNTNQEYRNFENQLLNEDFNDESYKTNFYNNNDEYRKNYNTNEENRYTYSSNNYNGKENYNNNNYNGNGYEGKREGMSDTRFMENGKYSLNGYEAGRGSTENEGFYEKNQFPNEFDTMEEYEKQQEEQGYTP